MGNARTTETQLRTAIKLKLEIRMFLRAMCRVVSRHALEQTVRMTYETLGEVKPKEVENDER